jgi:2-amino-4-hydroxy-6-hydroxymethyldihydropteridine diphosphokinase
VPPPTPVAIALGSSLGDGVATLTLAHAALTVQPGLRITRASPLYATPPEGGVARGAFVNAVLAGESSLAPVDLLVLLKRLELRLGRGSARRWADRALDLDLLLHGDTVCDVATPAGPLTLPHPRMRARAFVLVPLARAWPGARDPRDGERYADLPAARVPLPVVGVLANAPPATATRAG